MFIKLDNGEKIMKKVVKNNCLWIVDYYPISFWKVSTMHVAPEKGKIIVAL